MAHIDQRQTGGIFGRSAAFRTRQATGAGSVSGTGGFQGGGSGQVRRGFLGTALQEPAVQGGREVSVVRAALGGPVGQGVVETEAERSARLAAILRDIGVTTPEVLGETPGERVDRILAERRAQGIFDLGPLDDEAAAPTGPPEGGPGAAAPGGAVPGDVPDDRELANRIDTALDTSAGGPDEPPPTDETKQSFLASVGFDPGELDGFFQLAANGNFTATEEAFFAQRMLAALSLPLLRGGTPEELGRRQELRDRQINFLGEMLGQMRELNQQAQARAQATQFAGLIQQFFPNITAEQLEGLNVNQLLSLFGTAQDFAGRQQQRGGGLLRTAFR